MEHKVPKFTAVVKRKKPDGWLFVGGSDARIMMDGGEAALIRPRHEQHVQMKCQRYLVLRTRDASQTCSHAAKSSKEQAQCFRAVGRKSWRASHRRRQTAADLTTLVTGIRLSIKVCAILWQKLYARLSEHTLEQGNQVPVSRVATQLNIRNRVSTQTGRLNQVPNHPIERGPSDLMQLPWARKCAHLTCDKATTIFITSPNQGGIL